MLAKYVLMLYNDNVAFATVAVIAGVLPAFEVSTSYLLDHMQMHTSHGNGYTHHPFTPLGNTTETSVALS